MSINENIGEKNEFRSRRALETSLNGKPFEKKKNCARLYNKIVRRLFYAFVIKYKKKTLITITHAARKKYDFFTINGKTMATASKNY